MKYMFLMNESAGDFALRTHPEKAPAYWEGWHVYFQLVAKADADFTGAALQGAETATVLRGVGDAKRVQDGPYADAKEHLGGFFIVNVDNLDVALELAEACPAAKNGSVEVRPLHQMDE